MTFTTLNHDVMDNVSGLSCDSCMPDLSLLALGINVHCLNLWLSFLNKSLMNPIIEIVQLELRTALSDQLSNE